MRDECACVYRPLSVESMNKPIFAPKIDEISFQSSTLDPRLLVLGS